MTVLLSGSTGFLGSYLLKSFVEKGNKVIALKRSTSDSYRIADYLNKCTFYNIDEVDIKSIFEEHEIDIVINTVTDYGRINKSISSILETNVMFGVKLLEETVSNSVKAFINTDTLLQRDINSYALSKAQFVDWMKFLSSENTTMVNIKIEHMYGVGDDENKFIYWLINQLKSNVEKIDLTSGIQKRDFIYIDDIVTAYEAIVFNIDKFNNFEEFELGCGNSIEVREFVEKIYAQIKKKQELITKLNFGVITYRNNENMDMRANTAKLEKLDWKPRTTIDDGIKKILDGEK